MITYSINACYNIIKVVKKRSDSYELSVKKTHLIRTVNEIESIKSFSASDVMYPNKIYTIGNTEHEYKVVKKITIGDHVSVIMEDLDRFNNSEDKVKTMCLSEGDCELLDLSYDPEDKRKYVLLSTKLGWIPAKETKNNGYTYDIGKNYPVLGDDALEIKSLEVFLPGFERDADDPLTIITPYKTRIPTEVFLFTLNAELKIDIEAVGKYPGIHHGSSIPISINNTSNDSIVEKSGGINLLLDLQWNRDLGVSRIALKGVSLSELLYIYWDDCMSIKDGRSLVDDIAVQTREQLPTTIIGAFVERNGKTYINNNLSREICMSEEHEKIIYTSQIDSDYLCKEICL